MYQEVNLCPNLTVAENLLIGRQPRKWGRIDWKAMNRRATDILRGLDVEIDVTRQLGSYSIAIQQMAAIARALVISSAQGARARRADVEPHGPRDASSSSA